jgi:hypothetical protein
MSSVVPTISASADPIEAVGEAVLAFLIGKYILDASGQPAQLARAQQLLKIASALVEVNSNQAAGITDLQTALQNFVETIKDQALQLALNDLLATVSTQLAALEGTIIGKLAGATANVFITQVASVAQYYVTQLTTAAAAK